MVLLSQKLSGQKTFGQRASLKWIFLSKKYLICILFLWGMPSACGFNENKTPYGTIDDVSGFYGAVSGDEPAAVLVGRNMLVAGGNAADAAVAMAFSMAVGYNAEVSLGAGGHCLVHDSQNAISEVLDFIGPPASGKGAEYDVAVPGLVRGMAALNLRYGKFRWQTLLIPAERQARFGYSLSRAQARKMQEAGRSFAPDQMRILPKNLPNAKAAAKLNSKDVIEGQKLFNAELAVVLGRIRLGGAGQFYVGNYARQIAAHASASGANLTADDLAQFLPSWHLPISVELGANTFLLTLPRPAIGGIETVKAVETLKKEGVQRLSKLSRPQRQIKIVTAYHQMDAKNQTQLEKNTNQDLANQNGGADQLLAGSSFLTVDKNGLAVACNLSLHSSFGAGDTIPELGFALARPPNLDTKNAQGFYPSLPAPIMITRGAMKKSLLFSAVASGGSLLQPLNATENLAQIASEALYPANPPPASLRDILLMPHLSMRSPTTIMIAEPPTESLADSPLNSPLMKPIGKEVLQLLATEGFSVAQARQNVRAHALYCPRTLPADDVEKGFCFVAHAPSGFGLSQSPIKTD